VCKKNELAIGMYRCDQHKVLQRSDLTLSSSEGWSEQLTPLLTLTYNLLRSSSHKYWGHTKFPSMNIANIFFSYKTLYDTFNKYIAKILFITRQIYKHRQEYIYKRHSHETVIFITRYLLNKNYIYYKPTPNIQRVLCTKAGSYFFPFLAILTASASEMEGFFR
jgi:hypothetical protein